MAAAVTGSKTVTQGLAPHLSAAKLTALLAKAIENLTVGELMTLMDACNRVSAGMTTGTTIGAILK